MGCDSTEGPRITFWQMRLLLFPVLWPRDSNFTSLSLSLPIYTMGLALPPLEAVMAHPSTSFHDGDTLLSFRLPDLSSCWSLLPEYTLRTHPLPLSHPWGLALRLPPQRNLWWPSHHGSGTFSGLPQGPMRPSHPSQHIWHQAGSIGTALRDLKAVCILHARLGKKGTPKLCVECNVFLPVFTIFSYLQLLLSFFLSQKPLRAQSHCSFSCFLWQTDPKLVLMVSASWCPYLCAAPSLCVWVGIVTCF